MKTTILTRRALTCAILSSLTVFLAGCATPSKVPVYLNSQFNPAAVDRITVWPVVDLRQGKKVALDVNAIVLDHTKSMLQNKKYNVTLGSNTDALAKLTLEDLDAEQAEWVKTLPPSASRWMMILAVHDVTSKLTFGSTGNAEISGYFYDQQNATKLWHDKGIGQAGQGGLLGMLMVGTMSREALNQAIYNCVLSFPPKPKSK